MNIRIFICNSGISIEVAVIIMVVFLFSGTLGICFQEVLPNLISASAANSTNGILNFTKQSNASRMEITLKNDKLQSPDNGGQTFALLTTLIATGGAITGGIIGSFLTYKHTRELEEQKRRAQKEEENQLNAKIREIVRIELVTFSGILKRLLEGTEIREDVKTVMKQVISAQREYPKMSLERRASVFRPEALSKIEQAYQLFGIFSLSFNEEYSRFQDNKITLEKLRDNLDLKGLKDKIDKALNSLNEDTKS